MSSLAYLPANNARAMDAPPEKHPVDPSDETHGRPSRVNETRMSNALETDMTPPLSPGQAFGDYQIRGLIGRGKAGFVYSATDLLAQRRCAIKLLCRMYSRDLYRNKLGFRRMSPFRHPCLVRTDRIEIIDDYTVLAMEEIEGETLYDVAQGFSAMPREDAYRKILYLLHDYAVGLSIMHLGGLVHRDLKPTNLMVRMNGKGVRPEGQGVIVDYGLVANCDPEVDPHGLRSYIAGTPRYFSPEALWEQSYTPSGDVFSLGLVMLDCLNKVSGSDRWLRQGDFEDWVREEDEQTIADAVSGMDEGVPPLLRMAIAGMLSADRLKRPSSLEVVEMTKTDDNPVPLRTTHHLFGRESELEQCNEWIRSVYRGHTGRLHLFGKSGAGKTRLLDELERQLRQNNWGQVFRVKCRSRENQSLQVLDQIADQVAQRYSRSDRDRLQLDPVSAAILIHSFPQLRHVIDADLQETAASFDAAPACLDGLSAALRLSRQLRQVGPLIIIIDDAQWSDHDSDNVWDELQRDTEGFLGIITSSRNHKTNQRHPADKTIHIGPLPKPAAFSFLQTAANRWNTNINSAGLDELVEVSRCNAFRLHELAEEFRPGGMLHRVKESRDSSISNLGDVDRLWRTRFDRLSDDAKSVLAFVVTAGAPVSVLQLAELSGLGDRVDVSVFELVNQRLVIDDATGKECITVVHDKVANGLIENLTREELHNAHLSWASLLYKLNRPRDYAARIAEHYYAAEQDGAALPFAIIAAENADRAFAKAEAGRWHEKVLQQVVGDARDKHLHDAARCFLEADLPDKAADYFLIIGDRAQNPIEQLRHRTQAIQLLVRSSQIQRARPLLVEHAKALKIDLSDHGQTTFAGYRRQFATLAKQLSAHLRRDLDQIKLESNGHPSHQNATDDAAHLNRECMLDFCSEVSRSLTMLDIETTMQMVLQGCSRALQANSPTRRIRLGVMANVWAGLLSGRKTDLLHDCRATLIASLPLFRNRPAGKGSAEVRSGIAFAQALAMQWKDVPETVDSCVVDFIAAERPMRFEIAHTRWLRLWADWHLGHWPEMRSIAHEMVEDATRRNDSYQQLVATTGFAGNAFLVADEIDRLEHLCAGGDQIVPDTASIELVQFFQWIQAVQQSLYLGDFEAAADRVLLMRRSIGRSQITRIPLVMVSLDHLTALASLHLRQGRLDRPDDYAETPPHQLCEPAIMRGCVRRLRHRGYDFAAMLSAFFLGLDHRLAGNTTDAQVALERASRIAEQLELTPYQLAAGDALRTLRAPEAEADSLCQLMLNHGVVHPHRLERLYTVQAKRDFEASDN